MHQAPHSRSLVDWRTRTRTVALGKRTAILGILNVTPDSFSDGGQFVTPQAALERALQMLEDGADILDIGGESTRPNATPVSPQMEQDRALPVIEAIRKARPDAVLSIDTYHSGTARHALEAGAEIVNDVSGFQWDTAMAKVCAESGCGVVLMHTRGRPAEWDSQTRLAQSQVTRIVIDGLEQCLRVARGAGIAAEKIAFDPGFGFGKRGQENFALLAELAELRCLERPLLAGLSRKGFLRPKGHGEDSAAILAATLAANTAAILSGAHMIRVHDVRAARIAADIADEVLQTNSDS